MSVADLTAAIALFRSAVHEGAAHAYRPRQLQAWAPAAIDREAWAARIGRNRGWVVMTGEAMAGFAELAGVGHLDMLYVDPSHHRLGVASRLLARAEAAARELGAARLDTYASIAARPFFAARGFTVLERRTVRRAGQELDNLHMEKILAGREGAG